MGFILWVALWDCSSLSLSLAWGSCYLWLFHMVPFYDWTPSVACEPHKSKKEKYYWQNNAHCWRITTFIQSPNISCASKPEVKSASGNHLLGGGGTSTLRIYVYDKYKFCTFMEILILCFVIFRIGFRLVIITKFK